MQSYVATKTPVQALQSVYDAGKHKVSMSWDVLMLQSFMAGFYVGLGGHLALTVAGGMKTIGASDPGLQKFVYGAMFPVALYPIVMTGAELFTGDAMVLVVTLLGGKITLRQVARNWITAWIFNFIGCLTWAYFLSYLTGFFKYDPWTTYLFKVAHKKMELTFLECFLRGIGANFSVCLAVWLAITAADVPGKVSMMWWPVMAFAAIGFEHCIANMFVLSVCMMYGADMSIRELLRDSILPSTIGNVVGGSIFVGIVYFWLFDHMRAVTSIRTSSMSLVRHVNMVAHHPHHDHDDHDHHDHHDHHEHHDPHPHDVEMQPEPRTKVVALGTLPSSRVL